jgi:hypothetical protein
VLYKCSLSGVIILTCAKVADGVIVKTVAEISSARKMLTVKASSKPCTSHIIGREANERPNTKISSTADSGCAGPPQRSAGVAVGEANGTKGDEIRH